MTKIPNKENVTEITMFPIAYTKCQIGQDWFLNRFEVHFIPRDCYPDYIEVKGFIQQNIEGNELNIEQAAGILRDFLKNEYSPKGIKVIDHISNCMTHFDVDITVE